jgi:azurin
MIARSLTVLAVLSLVAFAALSTPATRAQDKAEVAVIEMTGNDQMQYNITEFKVKAGQTVKLTMTNIGKLPKVAMGHNVVVLKAGVNMIEFAVAANQAPPEYIPEARKDDMIAHTKLLGPDESETIEFTAPAAGSYDYLCTFPGHFAIMKGKMIVE